MENKEKKMRRAQKIAPAATFLKKLQDLGSSRFGNSRVPAGEEL